MGKTGILCSKQGIGLPFFGIRRFFVMQLHGASPSAIFAWERWAGGEIK